MDTFSQQAVLSFIIFCLYIFPPATGLSQANHCKYYSSVILPSHVSQVQMDSTMLAFYKSWKSTYIKNITGKNQLYVAALGAAGNKIVVSEGQGYGMVIVALMAGFDTAAQNIYNGLYGYYKAHLSKKSRVLMSWAQTKNFKESDDGSATDGDMDIAYSLLLANAFWGSNGDINYRGAANEIIHDIALQEINRTTFSILLGNDVEADSKDYFDMRSSDFMPSYCKAFTKFTGDSLWQKTVENNYKLFLSLQNKFSAEAGLLPDFIVHINGMPRPAPPRYLESKYDGAYSYNACRVPWRIATDFIVTGDERSYKILKKINRWIKKTTQNNPDNISAGYSLAGNDLPGRYFEALSFIASFAVAAMADKTNQQWLNQLWDYLTGFNIHQYDYYDNTIKMLALIILTGNYWVP